jgi:hypothetical protein
MIVVPYEPKHLDEMTMQPSQRYLRGFVTPEAAAAVAKHPAYTAVCEGEILGCGGVVPVWQGRAIAWSFISNNAGPHFVAITRAVRKFLDDQPQDRIETTVDMEFADGHRWARMLGFKLEAGRMAKYRPDGGTCSLYARVRA